MIPVPGKCTARRMKWKWNEWKDRRCGERSRRKQILGWSTAPCQLPRLEHPTKLKEQPQIPFTHHISACAHESCTVFFIMGPLIYVSYDFKKNSAYQQGIIAPPLKLMRIADSSLLVGPGGIVLPSPSSLSALHLEGEWLVICLALVLSWMGPSVSEGPCGEPCWKKGITLKEESLIFSAIKFNSLIRKEWKQAFCRHY